MKKVINNPFVLQKMQNIQMITVAMMFFLIFTVTGCGNSKTSDIGSASCENKEILKILNDEPAIVQKGCFNHVGRVDAFYFKLVNQDFEFFSDFGVFPAGVIPPQYKKEGLFVYISGNVTSCAVLAGCSEPNIRLGFMPLFELKSIKINN